MHDNHIQSYVWCIITSNSHSSNLWSTRCCHDFSKDEQMLHLIRSQKAWAMHHEDDACSYQPLHILSWNWSTGLTSTHKRNRFQGWYIHTPPFTPEPHASKHKLCQALALIQCKLETHTAPLQRVKLEVGLFILSTQTLKYYFHPAQLQRKKLELAYLSVSLSITIGQPVYYNRSACLLHSASFLFHSFGLNLPFSFQSFPPTPFALC